MTDDRMANSIWRTKTVVGQPSITDYGISKLFKESKKYWWFIKHDVCGEWFHPDFLKDCVEKIGDNWVIRDADWTRQEKRDPYLFCPKCGKPYERFSRGEWVAEEPSAETSFYHIGKEFSTKVTVRELCDAFSRGLDDDVRMQRFYNSDLGLPYTPRGAKIMESDLRECVADYVMPSSCANACVFGADVGTRIHVIINELLKDGSERAVFIGYVHTLEDIKLLCKRHNIAAGVIDALPEQRLSTEVASWRQFFKCFFSSSRADDRVNMQNKSVTVYRTGMLDEVLRKIKERKWLLPQNAGSIEDFFPHLCHNTRIFKEDKQEYEWLGNGEDHYAFAQGYAAIARRILIYISSI